jgi:arsenate reductase
MELPDSVAALAALAQPARLRLFQLLVRHGEAGLTAGAIAQSLAVPPSTLSFHLRDLTNAGLLAQRREGRMLHYRTVPARFRALLHYLGEDCCQGRRGFCGPLDERIQNPPGQREAAPAVLFLCSQNSARSQLAAAWLRHLAGARYRVFSAGLRPAAVHPLTRIVLAESGLPTASLVSTDLGALLGKQSFRHAFVVCATAAADCPQLPVLAEDQQEWPFPDPAAVPEGPRQLAAFRRVNRAIAAKLRGWLRSQPLQRTESAQQRKPQPRPTRRRR